MRVYSINMTPVLTCSWPVRGIRGLFCCQAGCAETGFRGKQNGEGKTAT
jgi:hypothetical protein